MANEEEYIVNTNESKEKLANDILNQKEAAKWYAFVDNYCQDNNLEVIHQQGKLVIKD